MNSSNEKSMCLRQSNYLLILTKTLKRSFNNFAWMRNTKDLKIIMGENKDLFDSLQIFHESFYQTSLQKQTTS